MNYVVLVWRNGGGPTVNGGEILSFWATEDDAAEAAAIEMDENPPSNAIVYKVC